MCLQIAYQKGASEALQRAKKIADFASMVEHAKSSAPEEDSRVLRLLPDWRSETETRRFLVTFLSLKTGLRASVTADSDKTDNVSSS